MDPKKKREISLGKRKCIVMSDSDDEVVLSESSSTFQPTLDKTVHPTYSAISGLQKFQTEWAIKVNVVRKGNKEGYANTKNVGKIFKLILMDDEGSIIQAVIFNDDIDRLQEFFSKGQTYIITNGIVSAVKEEYMSPHPKLELILNKSTKVDAFPEILDHSLLKFDFVKISDVNAITNKDKVVDVIGLVINVEPCSMFNMGEQKGMGARRNILLTDNSNEVLQINLWADLALFEGDFIASREKGSCTIAVTKIKSAFYQGSITWGTTSCTVLIIDPIGTEVIAAKSSLTGIEQGNSSKTKFIPPEILYESISIKSLTHCNDTEIKGTHCCFKGRVEEIKNLQMPWYNACTGCKKKVNSPAEIFNCDFCTSKNYLPRFMLRMLVSDGPSQVIVTLFDAAATILGAAPSDYVCNGADELSTTHKKAELKALEGKSFKFYLNVKTAKDRLKGNVVAENILQIDDDSNK